MEEQLIVNVSEIITVNESIANEMSKRYKIKKPHVILNSFESKNCIIEKNKLQESLNIQNKHRILLLQGGLSPHRNLEKLVESFKYIKTKDVILVILGSGPLEEKLQKIAKNMGLLNKRIFLHKAVLPEILPSYTASAWMGIIPYPHVDLNSYYCTPNKLFEYIDSETPIIGNNSPELCRFIRDTGFGIIGNMKSSKDIAKIIDEAAQSDKYDDWKDKLKSEKNLYSWNSQKYKYLNIIKCSFLYS